MGASRQECLVDLADVRSENRNIGYGIGITEFEK